MTHRPPRNGETREALSQCDARTVRTTLHYAWDILSGYHAVLESLLSPADPYFQIQNWNYNLKTGFTPDIILS